MAVRNKPWDLIPWVQSKAYRKMTGNPIPLPYTDLLLQWAGHSLGEVLLVAYSPTHKRETWGDPWSGAAMFSKPKCYLTVIHTLITALAQSHTRLAIPSHCPHRMLPQACWSRVAADTSRSDRVSGEPRDTGLQDKTGCICLESSDWRKDTI